MNAFARPGTIHQLPPTVSEYLGNAWLETLVRMLIDSTCSLAVAASKPEQLRQAITAATFAQAVAPQQADIALVGFDAELQAAERLLAELPGGTDIAPETGATVIIECERISKISEVAHFSVTGPGVKACNSFSASSNWWMHAREQRKDRFPCGIDIILLDQFGNMVALPRSSQLSENKELESQVL